MSAAESRAELDEKLLAWMRSDWDSQDDSEDETRFESLALELFAHQYASCLPYARFCDARGAPPGRVGAWREIPAVPAGAFKEVALRCFPAERVVHSFRTSGTATSRRGELHLDTLALYEASLLPTIRRFVFPELESDRRMAIRVLAPSSREAPDSSLSHMFGCALARLGTPASGWDVVGGELREVALEAAISRLCEAGEPVALCGTSFAFVHWIESLRARRASLALPDGSRLMETGGFKGRSREMPRSELHAALEERLGVPQDRIINQYGMTELASQFYDSVLARAGETRRKLGPPWARVRIIDPQSGRDTPSGEVGMIVIHDLANTGSVAAVQTADLGRVVGDERGEPGFEVLGREPEAEERGCSIAADVMLGA